MQNLLNQSNSSNKNSRTKDPTHEPRLAIGIGCIIAIILIIIAIIILGNLFIQFIEKPILN